MMCNVTHQWASFLFILFSFHFISLLFFSFSMYFRFISSRPVHHRRSCISCLSSPHQTSSTSCPSISTQRALLETTAEEPHLCGHAPAVSGTGSLDVVFSTDLRSQWKQYAKDGTCFFLANITHIPLDCWSDSVTVAPKSSQSAGHYRIINLYRNMIWSCAVILEGFMLIGRCKFNSVVVCQSLY